MQRTTVARWKEVDAGLGLARSELRIARDYTAICAFLTRHSFPQEMKRAGIGGTGRSQALPIQREAKVIAVSERC